MDAPALETALIAGTFALAGAVKGLTGMGLPLVAMGLLSVLIAPVQAAALLVVPACATNVWQFFSGPHRLPLLRRMWSMLLASAVVTAASSGLIAHIDASRAKVYLGVALGSYAALSLSKVRFRITPRHEIWLGPLAGALTGVIAGATGVFSLPAVPYLQALELDHEDLVQALGLSFAVSTLGLALGLAGARALHLKDLDASLWCMVPAILGMLAGQAVRVRMHPRRARLVFLVGLLLLGLELIARGVRSR